MEGDFKMIDKLICPDCKTGIMFDKDKLRCTNCKMDFKIVEGIPLLLPKSLSYFKKTEMNFYKKEFLDKKNQFGFVESEWNKDSFGLLDFIDGFDSLPKNSKILEIGAGNAQYSLILNKKGFKNTTASDISPNGLLSAKKTYNKYDSSYVVIDAENIPFESNTFDVVFLTAALHHLPDPEKGIAEMKRCVKRGGLIIVAVEPNTWYYYLLRPILKLLRLRRINKSKDSFSIADEVTHGFTLSRLKKYFKRQHIKIVKIQRVWYLTGIV